MDPWNSRNPSIEVSQERQGRVVCPTCGETLSLSDRYVWTGHRHRRCGQRLRIIDDPNQPEPVWCVVGNMRPEGVRAFDGGTKVYCFAPQWGDGWERVLVVGKHRQSGKFARVFVSRWHLRDLRVELIRSPGLLDRLSGPWDASEQLKELAVRLVKMAELDRKGGEV